jgi:hypothetical protein
MALTEPAATWQNLPGCTGCRPATRPWSTLGRLSYDRCTGNESESTDAAPRSHARPGSRDAQPPHPIRLTATARRSRSSITDAGWFIPADPMFHRDPGWFIPAGPMEHRAGYNRPDGT